MSGRPWLNEETGMLEGNAGFWWSREPIAWPARRAYAGPEYDLILNDDGTPKLDENGQWIWLRRE